jgi:subtilisin family serine protease
MAKLDVELDSLLVRMAEYKKNPGETAYFVDPAMLIPVSVEFSGDIGPLREAGFVAREVYGNIAYGTIDVDTLVKLDQIPSVVAIMKQRGRTILLDKSIPDIKANNIWSRSGDSFSGYTGRGVIVGIIDTGIDFRHKNFIKPDGKSRIWRIWDQTLSPEAPESAPAAITSGPFTANLGYGVEYTWEQISNALSTESPAVPVRHKDDNGHGTHVAGIAAGNGKQAGGCNGEYTYIGVAPEAELVIVRYWGLTDGDGGAKKTPPANRSFDDLLADAIRYIFNETQKVNKPVVINCSFGLFSQLMDGSHPVCQDVNNLLNNNSTGRAVVWAAGNEADLKFHATGTVNPSGSPPFDLEFKIHGSDTDTRSIAIVYSGSNLEVQVISPIGGTDGTISWVSVASGSPPGSGSSSTANGTIVGGTSGTVTVRNRNNEIRISITPPKKPSSPGEDPENGSNIASTKTANWKIQLRNTTGTPTAFNAYCLYGSTHDRKSPHFLNHTTTNSTLGQEATGTQCITVGSYAVGKQLASSSGRGPTLDGRTKPDLCAPGVDITSTGIATDRAGDSANCCCECCQDWYVGKGGTSMAAPHITGGIALMLHKNPNLTHTEIKNFLTTGADGRPGDAPPADIPGWGAGKLSVMNSVNPAPEVNPPIPIVAAAPLPPSILLKQFLETDYGPVYYDLAQKYFQEILTLVNTNKRVATAWHRSMGPVWTRLALNAFYDHEFKIPLFAHGMHFTESLDRFLPMLKRYGSQELQADLERYQPPYYLVQEEMTILDLMAILGNLPLPERQAVPAGL